MDYELNDQDRADIVTGFVKKYARWAVLAIVLIALGFGVNTYIQKKTHAMNEAASMAYQALLLSIQNKASPTSISEAANTIIVDYPRSVYASLAELNLADSAVSQNNLSQAEGILKTTLSKNSDNALTPIVAIRLARVLLAENNPAAALAVLKDPPKGFVGSYALLSGDAYVLENNTAMAKQSFQQAAAASQNNPLISQLATERLNAVGVTLSGSAS